MKRILLLPMLLVLLLVLGGCSGTNETLSNSDTGNTFQTTSKTATTSDDVTSSEETDAASSTEFETTSASVSTDSSEDNTDRTETGKLSETPEEPTDDITSSSSPSPSSVAASTDEALQQTDPNGQTIYRAPTGKRYHLDPDCGGKNSYVVTFDEATGAGLTPCKKCAQ